MYSFQSPFAYAANNPIYYVDHLGLGPRDWWKSVKSWVSETFGGGDGNQNQNNDNNNSNNTSQSTDPALPGGTLPEVVVEADRINPSSETNEIRPVIPDIKGPEFSGDVWDWLNKINNIGNRHWIHSETGVAYIIDDHGNIVRPAPTTGIAPSPGGKGKQTFIKGVGFVKNNILHHSIKPNILKAVGKRNFAHVVGKNPNVAVENGKIILQGTGANSGKVYKTGLDASNFFGN